MEADSSSNAPWADDKRHFRGNYRMADVLLLLGAAVIVCLLGIGDDSLWMDEGWSVWCASFSSVGPLIHETMLDCRDAVAQMPFYSLYLWAWAQAFGMGEVVLRLSNVPLVLLLLFAMQVGSIRLYGRHIGWMIIMVSPFLWFYVNEVRPYVAVMAFAAVASVSLLCYVVDAARSRRWAPWLCLLSSFLLCGVHMLGVFLIPTLVTGIVLANGSSREKWRETRRDWLLPGLVFLPFFFCLGGYFVWTLWQEAHGVKGIPGLRNVAFAWYEFMGFLGLGPPRNALREAPLENAFRYSGTLALGVGGWLIALMFVFTQSKADLVSKRIVLLCEMLLTGAVFSIVSAVIGRHSFWGRHVAEFFPLFILIVVGLLAGDSEKDGSSRARRLTTACLMAIWLVSAMRLAFLQEYRKDDYRGAASCVLNAAGEKGTILWAADIPAASYYGLRFDDIRRQIYRPTARLVSFAGNWSEEQLEAAFRTGDEPFIVAVSRADLFDRQNTIMNWVKKKGGQLIGSPSAFRIYSISRTESQGQSSASARESIRAQHLASCVRRDTTEEILRARLASPGLRGDGDGQRAGPRSVLAFATP